MNPNKILFITQFDPGRQIQSAFYTEILVCRYTNKFEKKWKHFRLGWNFDTERMFEHELGQVEWNSYPLIIVHEIFSWNPIPLIKFIRSKNESSHIIYWLRNSLFAEKYGTGLTAKNIDKFLNLQKKYRFNIVTFDTRDCKKYGLIYGPQAMQKLDLNDKQVLDKERTIKWDVFWYGKDKNRISQILKMKKFCDENGLSYNLNVLRQKKRRYSSEIKPFLLQKEMPYIQYLERMAESRAILDIVQEGQGGLDARPIEAIRLHKKLITSYKRIKEYDFYRKENVFILGEDPIEDLKNFIMRPYEEIPCNIIYQYSFKGMLQTVYQTMHWDWSELE